MKTKILIILFSLVVILFTTGITYSIFNSKNNLFTDNQNIAKFIFEAEQTDEIAVPIEDLEPNTFKEFAFQVSNNADGKKSNVTLNYQITIKTFHFMPLVIELFKEGIEQPIMTCDETYTRNNENELVCNSPYQEMNYDKMNLDEYKLKVTFPKEYNTVEYSDLVDFIDLNIQSFQKTEKAGE